VAVFDVEGRLADFEHGQIRGGLAVGDAVALEPGDTLDGEAAAELIEEARLADARLAGDADDVAVSGSGAGKTILEDAQFALPANQLGEAEVGADFETRAHRAPAGDLEHLDGLTSATHRDSSQRLAADVPLDEAMGGG